MNEVEFYKELLIRLSDVRYVTYELMQRPKTEDFAVRINGEPCRHEINFTSKDVIEWVYKDNLEKILDRAKKTSNIEEEQMMLVLLDKMKNVFDVMLDTKMLEIGDINGANLYVHPPKYTVECIRVKLSDNVKQALNELSSDGIEMNYMFK